MTPAERLASLRVEIDRAGLHGFLVPLADEHLGEYVGAYAHRLAWLSGFDGSAGTGIVTADRAALFVDGRYTEQARAQADDALWDICPVPATDFVGWLAVKPGAGHRIGYDPWLHSVAWLERQTPTFMQAGLELVPTTDNLVDAIWSDRPAPSLAPLFIQPDRLAGRTSADKRAAIGRELASSQCDGVILTALDAVAWTFNVRGNDVARVPFARAYASIGADGKADLFVDPRKLTPEVTGHLSGDVRLHDHAAFGTYLRGLSSKAVSIDPERTVAAIAFLLTKAGARIVRMRDPTVLPRAIKTPAEIAGSRAAHLRDGSALTRFLHWFSIEAPKGGLTEASAATRLLAFRQETSLLRDLSFDTISGADANGAIPHYRLTLSSNRPIGPDSIYLVDSGGQYADGTTDVTRTIAVGTPTCEHRDRFTRMLKGHIALARAVFPPGTCGAQLDILARQFLWSGGFDYPHGTGHGVGSYLGVHEGPQRIAKPAGGQAGTDEPLRPGMILSNEPGYYRHGRYGLRVENLVLVEARAIDGGDAPMLGFETLTLAPIDRVLIDLAMLRPDERVWLDAYHTNVRRQLGPFLPVDARQWLHRATLPVADSSGSP